MIRIRPLVAMVALIASLGCGGGGAGGGAPAGGAPASGTLTIAVIPKGTSHVFWRSIHKLKWLRCSWRPSAGSTTLLWAA